jgi:hypothetical protein
MRTFIIILFAGSLLASCSKTKMNGPDYVRFIEDEANGLKVSKNIGEVKYTLQYKPAAYIRLRENQKSAEDGMQYYTLSLSLVDQHKDIMRYDLHGQNEYYERANYLSYGLMNDIFLVENGDTLKCELFNYVRTYGLSPQADMVIGFRQPVLKAAADKLFVLDDKLFGGGLIKLKISAEDIENLPAAL